MFSASIKREPFYDNLPNKENQLSVLKTVPKTVFCKVIAVLKTISFLYNMKCLLFMTFFVCYVALVLWQDQLMTSLETSSNALYTPTYWLLRLTISGVNFLKSVDELDKHCQKQCLVK